ncbi:hypothetical protein [Sphingomonas sp. TF3]|uniref:hypothetical protein n=1 Tax=Sphingomonas sp. TF3 TaxID=2495580 RepID=UPI0026783BCD
MLLSFLLLLAAPQTQADMNRSAGSSYARADAAMTAQWKRTYAYMKGRDAQDTSRGGGFGYVGDKLLTTGNAGDDRDTALLAKLGLVPMTGEEPMRVAAA